MPELQTCGRIEGFDVYYNPINHRMICERRTDLVTVLFDYPSYHVVHSWGAAEDEVTRLRMALMQDTQ